MVSAMLLKEDGICEKVQLRSLEDYQKYCGGNITSLPRRKSNSRLVGYCCEDGLFNGMKLNSWSTILKTNFGFRGQLYYGPVLMLSIDEEGEEHTIDKNIEKELRALMKEDL